jgi:protease-4
MSFESDSLIDRKRLKRRLGLWRLTAVIAIAGIGLALFSRFDAA